MSGGALFAHVMALSPALFTLIHEWVRARTWGVSVSRAIASLTLLCVGALALIRLGPPAGFRGILDRWGASVVPVDMSPSGILRLFLVALWVGLVTRLLGVAQKERRGPLRAQNGPRGASLNSRAGVRLVSSSAWVFLFAVWGQGSVTVLVGYLLMDGAPGVGSRLLALALFLVTLALAACAPLAVGAIAAEAEPFDYHGSRSLADEYAVHRRARATGYYWLTLALIAWVGLAVPVSILTAAPSSSVTLGLESSAYAIGIAGSMLGIRLADGRRRILDTLAAISGEEARLRAIA
jgi:hypothetical protein